MNSAQWWDSWPVAVLLIISVYAVAAFVSAGLIKVCCSFLLRFSPSYGMALKAVAIVVIAMVPFVFLMAIPNQAIQIAILAVSFMVSAVILGKFIKKDGDAIGTGNGAALAVGWTVSGSVLVCVGVFLFWIAFKPSPVKSAPAAQLYSDQEVFGKDQKPWEVYQKKTGKFDPNTAVPIASQSPNETSPKRSGLFDDVLPKPTTSVPDTKPSAVIASTSQEIPQKSAAMDAKRATQMQELLRGERKSRQQQTGCVIYSTMTDEEMARCR